VGVVESRVISAAEIRRLAELPPRGELLGGIAGLLTAPVAGIVGVLGGLLRDLALMIEEVARKNEAKGA
jgi:large subunit ribosomal protein L10